MSLDAPAKCTPALHRAPLFCRSAYHPLQEHALEFTELSSYGTPWSGRRPSLPSQPAAGAVVSSHRCAALCLILRTWFKRSPGSFFRTLLWRAAGICGAQQASTRTGASGLRVLCLPQLPQGPTCHWQRAESIRLGSWSRPRVSRFKGFRSPLRSTWIFRDFPGPDRQWCPDDLKCEGRRK